MYTAINRTSNTVNQKTEEQIFNKLNLALEFYPCMN